MTSLRYCRILAFPSINHTQSSCNLLGNALASTANLTSRRSLNNLASSILLGRHVKEALSNGCPIVALESTVITHGLPEPQNLELALQLEREIFEGRWWSGCADNSASRRNDSMKGVVVPATVGIVKGQLIVGLSRDELQYLATSELSRPIKASRRDIAIAQALALSAGTTVSATMAIATSCSRKERIAVFATGGLGGVHLGGELSMDVSADLYEMSRSPIGLVSSGFKSFLDTRRSLELLETFGCTVASLKPSPQTHVASQQTGPSINPDESQSSKLDTKWRTSHLFPGFFTVANKEQVRSPWQCDSVSEAARILYHCLADVRAAAKAVSCGESTGHLQNGRAMLLACPIPSQFSLDETTGQFSRALLDEISAKIDKRPDLGGSEKTPLILAELSRATGGTTLGANLELLRNNARVGAHLAYEYTGLCQRASLGAPPSQAQVHGRHKTGRSGEAIPDLGRAEGASTTTQSQSDQEPGPNPAEASVTGRRAHLARNSPLVVGCTMIDMHVRTEVNDRFKSNPAHSGVTFNGEPRMMLGGVGRNLAAALQLLGHRPTFITSLAADNLGEFARNELHKLWRRDSSARRVTCQTERDELIKRRLIIFNWTGVGGEESSSCFALVLIDSLSGQCEFVVANLAARQALSANNLAQAIGQRNGDEGGDETARPPLIVMDANLPVSTIDYLLGTGHRWRVPVFLEPTDVVCLPELVRLVRRLEAGGEHEKLGALAYLSPNVVELETLLALFAGDERAPAQTASWSVEQVETMARSLMQLHLPQLRCLLVTMDKRGLLVGLRTSGEMDRAHPNERAGEESGRASPGLTFKHYPPAELVDNPVSSSGAGDCFAAGFISGLIRNMHLKDCVELGFEASRRALKSTSTVPDSLGKLRYKSAK